MDEKFVDYYKLLDVDISCSTETIRNTYLQLAKKNHPDQGGNAEKFQLICEAYECLYNKIKLNHFIPNLNSEKIYIYI